MGRFFLRFHVINLPGVVFLSKPTSQSSPHLGIAMVDIRRRIEAPVAVPRPVKALENFRWNHPGPGVKEKTRENSGKHRKNHHFLIGRYITSSKCWIFFQIVMLVFFWGGGGSNMEPKVMEVLRSNVVPCQFGDL